MSFSKTLFSSLVMSSSGGPGMVMGKYDHKMRCRMTVAALLILARN